MSSDGQSSGRAGLEAQRRAIAAACKRHRWQLLELVEEIGRTAEDAKRPGIAEPLRLLVPTAQGGRRWYPTTIRYTLNRTT